MNELLIEQKAKAYDKAIEMARDFYKANLKLDNVDENLVLEDIFPELKESEDERIRKALIDYFDDANKADENPLQSYGVHTDKVIAWLEKQGQVKESLISQHENKKCKENGNSLTSEDERIKENIIATIHLYYGEPLEDEAEEMLAWLEKQGEQTPAWSEEDKDFMYDTLSNLTELKDRYGEGYGNVGKCIDWLKSLKERVLPPKQEWSEEDEKRELKKLPVEENSATAKGLEDELEAFLCKYEDVSSEEKARLIGVAEHFYLIGKNPNTNL